MKFKKLFSALLLGAMAIPLASCAVRVESIEASVPSSIYVGDTYDLEVIVTPNDADIQDYTFTSSDESILKVDGNQIKGLKVGSVELTLASLDEKVKPVVYPVSVVHKYATDFTADIPSEMKIGDETHIDLTFDPVDTTFTEYEVEVANNEVASYTKETNTLKALSVGKTDITVKVGELSKKYELTVKHILPTAISANIPSEITTLDYIALDVKFEPANATLKDYQVTISNPDVLTYNPVEKTLNPKAVGSTNVVISSQEANVSKTYNLNVVKGYKAPTTHEAYVDFARTVLPNALDKASDIEYSGFEGSAYNDLTTTTNATYKRSENAVSAQASIKESDAEQAVKFEAIKTIENNQFINISNNPDYPTFEIHDIDEKYPLEDAKEELKLDILDMILDQLDTYVDNKTNVATTDPETGAFVLEYTTDVTSYGDKTTTVVTIDSTKTGVINEVKFEKSVLKSGETKERVLNNSTFKFTYNELHKREDLFITDYTPYLATSFDVEYTKELHVGDTINTYYLKVKNVAPATALNMEDTNIEYIDEDNVLDLSGFYPEFVKAGSVKLVVSPKYYIGEKVSKTITLTATVPAAQGFEYAKLDTTDSTYKVGSTYNLDAKITPSGAAQGYSVASSDTTKAEVSKSNEGVWSVKLLKAGDVTLTFKADSDATITKDLKITIVEDKPAQAAAYVGTYDMTIGYFDYVLTLNEKDGTIVNKANSKQEATLKIVNVYGTSKKFMDIEFTVLGSIDMKTGKSTSKFDPATNTLEFKYATKNGINKTLNLTKNPEKELPAYCGDYALKIGYFDFIVTLNEKDGVIVNKDTGVQQGTLTLVDVYGSAKIFIDIQFNITGSVDMGNVKRTSKFDPATNTLEFKYSTKNGIDKTVTISKVA